jgi:hypothetical protein
MKEIIMNDGLGRDIRAIFRRSNPTSCLSEDYEKKRQTSVEVTGSMAKIQRVLRTRTVQSFARSSEAVVSDISRIPLKNRYL